MHLRGSGIKAERERADWRWFLPVKSQGRPDNTSKKEERQERNKSNKRPREEQTTNNGNNNNRSREKQPFPPESQIAERHEPGQDGRTGAAAFREINRSYNWTCVLDFLGCGCEGRGGRRGARRDGGHTMGPEPSIMAQCLTHQTPVVELPLPLFMATGGLDEAELFILAGLIIHALSHSRGKAETEAQTSRGPGGEWNPSEEPPLFFFSPFFFLIWESAGVAPCSRPRCLPQRGGEGQLVYAGGRRTGALSGRLTSF